MSESKMQEALIKASNLKWWGQYLFAIPNGGLRDKGTAAKLKREGVRPGIPDLFLSIATQTYSGLYIELKYGKNKLTKNQSEYMERFSGVGYRCIVCYDWEDAFKTIENYLRSKPKYHPISGLEK